MIVFSPVSYHFLQPSNIASGKPPSPSSYGKQCLQGLDTMLCQCMINLKTNLGSHQTRADCKFKSNVTK